MTWKIQHRAAGSGNERYEKQKVKPISVSSSDESGSEISGNKTVRERHNNGVDLPILFVPFRFASTIGSQPNTVISPVGKSNHEGDWPTLAINDRDELLMPNASSITPLSVQWRETAFRLLWPFYQFILSRLVQFVDSTEEEHLTVRDLYPGLTDAELMEAEANLPRFATILLKVYTRVTAERKQRA